jgi:hypothetical protein
MADKRKPRGAAIDRTDEELDEMTSAAAMMALADEAQADAETLAPELGAMIDSSDADS